MKTIYRNLYAWYVEIVDPHCSWSWWSIAYGLLFLVMCGGIAGLVVNAHMLPPLGLFLISVLVGSLTVQMMIALHASRMSDFFNQNEINTDD